MWRPPINQPNLHSDQKNIALLHTDHLLDWLSKVDHSSVSILRRRSIIVTVFVQSSFHNCVVMLCVWLWLCNCVTVWLRWLCNCVTVWLCVAVWLCNPRFTLLWKSVGLLYASKAAEHTHILDLHSNPIHDDISTITRTIQLYLWDISVQGDNQDHQ